MHGCERPAATRREDPKEAATRTAKDFGRRLITILEELDISRAQLAELSCIDKSTIDKLISGETVQPLLVSALALIRGVAMVSIPHASALACDFVAVRATAPGDADFNHDGLEDERDLVPGAAEMVNGTSELLTATLQALTDDMLIDNAERVRLTAILTTIRDVSNRIEDLLKMANDKWSWKKRRRTTDEHR